MSVAGPPFDPGPILRHPVVYQSDGRELSGYFLTPDGGGPFPALVFSHGSQGFLLERNTPGILALHSLGYAVFVAGRRGYDGHPGPFWKDLVAEAREPEHGATFHAFGAALVAAMQAECDDVLAALDWLRARREVDPNRLGHVGQSFGGILSLLVASKADTVRAAVSFAGPSITWPDAPALQRLLRDAAVTAHAPLFLIQAENDHSLEPTYALGLELHRHGKPHELRIYPPHGKTAAESHGFFGRCPEVWQGDVERFLMRWPN